MTKCFPISDPKMAVFKGFSNIEVKMQSKNAEDVILDVLQNVISNIIFFYLWYQNPNPQKVPEYTIR